MWYTVYICMSIINVLLHGFGLYGLVSLLKHSRHKPQRLLLINMSAWELLSSILLVLLSSLLIYRHHNAAYYVYLFFSFMYFSYFASMVYITIERLAKVSLGMRYTNYWSEQKTKNLIMLTWVLVILACVVACVVCYHIHPPFRLLLYRLYICYCVLCAMFMVLVIFTYSVILYKYKRSSEAVNGQTRKSVFLVPTLLIATFILFVIIPNVLTFFDILGYVKLGNTGKVILLIIFRISYLSDAVIYIFYLPDMRRFCVTKLKLIVEKITLPSRCCGNSALDRNHVKEDVELPAMSDDRRCYKTADNGKVGSYLRDPTPATLPQGAYPRTLPMYPTPGTLPPRPYTRDPCLLSSLSGKK